MASHILPDDIRKIDDREMPDKITVMYQYIRYMREQIDFWGINRSNDISKAYEQIDSIKAKMGTMYRIEDDTLYITTQ